MVDEVLSCASRWAKVRAKPGAGGPSAVGWLPFDFQCDHRLTTCASKEAVEVPEFLEPAK
jgi:hypothetical protein